MAIKGYVLTVDDEAGVTPAELAASVEAAGFVVVRTLEAIGVIVGRADEVDVDRIREVPGVAAIDEDGTLSL